MDFSKLLPLLPLLQNPDILKAIMAILALLAPGVSPKPPRKARLR